MDHLHRIDYQSPIGIIEIAGTDEAVCSILFVERDKIINNIQECSPEALVGCYYQLDEYFNGVRQQFSFPYILDGTDFQKSVWKALTKIHYGQTGSYKDIALMVQNEKAVRAVGSANGKNKLSIVIPCHRIIGANGKLTGYAGGLWRKEWLLQHEKTFLTGKL